MRFRELIPVEATSHYRRQCEYKRLDILCSLLEDGDKVLDVGCGIGTYSSNPLSYLPIDITAIDSDAKTIEYANERNGHRNLKFIVASGETYKSQDKYDLIICSHILEHVIEPKLLLENMRKLLKNDGILYLGLPNGFGTFEMQNAILRIVSKFALGKQMINKVVSHNIKDTLNTDSPHLSFFTVKRIKRLLNDTGWHIVRQFNDEFIGGVIPDRILPKVHIIAKWNVRIANRIPMSLANGWLFICQKN